MKNDSERYFPRETPLDTMLTGSAIVHKDAWGREGYKIYGVRRKWDVQGYTLVCSASVAMPTGHLMKPLLECTDK